MGKRKIDYRLKPFEGSPNERHIRFTHSMRESKAFRDLSRNAKILYLYMKFEYQGPDKTKTRRTNKGSIELEPGVFIYTYADAREQLDMDGRTFTKARDELLEHGLIEMKQQGFHKADPNIYAFSEKWKEYGIAKIEGRAKRMNAKQVEAVKKALKQNNFYRMQSK